MYFRLDDKGCKVDMAEIMSVLAPFLDKLYDETGLNIEPFTCPMYLRLDDTQFKYNKSEMMKILIASLRKINEETGFNIGIFMAPTCMDLDTYCKVNGLEIATEEVLEKNMTVSERIDKFVEYIEKIGGVKGDLLIVDPYLFFENHKKKNEDYPEMLAQIFKRAECASITVVTRKETCCNSLFETVKQKYGAPINVAFSNDFHDRYWIANQKKGFLSGTSMNGVGVGKKYSIIQMLEDDDVKEIVKLVENITQTNSEERI